MPKKIQIYAKLCSTIIKKIREWVLYILNFNNIQNLTIFIQHKRILTFKIPKTPKIYIQN